MLGPQGPAFYSHNHSACLKHRLFTRSLKAPRSYFLQSLHTGFPLPGMLSISHPKGTPKYQCTALPDSTAYDQTASVCSRGEGIISNPVSKHIITADEILKPCYGKEFQGGNGEAQCLYSPLKSSSKNICTVYLLMTSMNVFKLYIIHLSSGLWPH